MRLIDRAVLSAGEPGTSRAVATFPAFVVLGDGSLVATYSIGSGKDTGDDVTFFWNQIDAPPGLPAWFGSPASFVAPSVEPVVEKPGCSWLKRIDCATVHSCRAKPVVGQPAGSVEV